MSLSIGPKRSVYIIMKTLESGMLVTNSIIIQKESSLKTPTSCNFLFFLLYKRVGAGWSFTIIVEI